MTMSTVTEMNNVLKLILGLICFVTITPSPGNPLIGEPSCNVNIPFEKKKNSLKIEILESYI